MFLFSDKQPDEKETPQFMNWGPTYPSKDGSNKDCVTFLVDPKDGSTGMWKDESCTTGTFWAICEKKPLPVTTTSAATTTTTAPTGPPKNL